MLSKEKVSKDKDTVKEKGADGSPVNFLSSEFVLLSKAVQPLVLGVAVESA